MPGGVRLPDGAPKEPPRERVRRSALELAAKAEIAALAATRLRDGMVVFLDAGTTCEAVVPHLVGHAGLTVVTSDFHTLDALSRAPGIDVIHTGGTLDRERAAANGPLAAATARALGIDLYLMSTGTWDLAHGVSVPVSDTVLLKQAVLEVSRSCLLLADSTKYGAFERYRVAPLHQLDGVVTDARLGDPDRAAIEAAGVRVLVAGS